MNAKQNLMQTFVLSFENNEIYVKTLYLPTKEVNIKKYARVYSKIKDLDVDD